jgi:hypothetical protein
LGLVKGSHSSINGSEKKHKPKEFKNAYIGRLKFLND